MLVNLFPLAVDLGLLPHQCFEDPSLLLDLSD